MIYNKIAKVIFSSIMFVNSCCFGHVFITNDGDNILKTGQIFYIQISSNVSCGRICELKPLPSDSCIRHCETTYEKIPLLICGRPRKAWYKFQACKAGHAEICFNYSKFGHKCGKTTYTVVVQD